MVWLLEIEVETVGREDLFGGNYCAVSFIPSKRVVRGPSPSSQEVSESLVHLPVIGRGEGWDTVDLCC